MRTDGKVITDIIVKRGAPCGATWDAAEKLKGTPLEDADKKIGLESQFFCITDPSKFDPVSGKSSLHIAGELHSKAMKDAVNKKKV